MGLLQKLTGQELATRPDVSVAHMLQTVIEKGITPDNVQSLEKLVGLYERMQDREAERQFNEAFVKLQNEMPRIDATKPVPNRDGSIRYTYAPFENLMEKVQPFLTANGFSVSFTTRFAEGRLIAVCMLRHTGGHSQQNEFGVRVGQGPPHASETQSDGAAKTYAKRGALSDCLNIVIEHDDDARILGKPLGKALAEDLHTRVKRLGDRIDEQAFLKFAGAACHNPAVVEDYMNIPEDRFDTLDQMLTKKERGNGKSKSVEPDASWD